jgi:hypothetical protein
VCAWNATDALRGHFNCLSPTVIKPREIKNEKEKDANRGNGMKECADERLFPSE